LNQTNFENSELFKSLSLDLDNTIHLFKEKNLDTNNFCVMPFVNLILEPNGNVGICRHKGHDFTFGNIRHKTIQEILSSEQVVNWRKELLTNQPTVCKIELEDRKCNLCPELNKLLPFAELDNVINPKTLRLTANLNGQCNLRCQMCTIWQEPNDFYTEENFWIPARNTLFKEIKEIDFLSGEPFIQKDTFKFIDEISPINPDCLWSFTTNLHWKLTDEVKAALNKIQIKYFLISLDSLTEETYHKIRYPGKLSFVLENLNEIIKYEQERKSKKLSTLNLKINFLIQKDNWKELKSTITFCLEKNIPPFISFLYGPKQLSLLNFSHEERINILDYYFSNLTKTEILFSLRVFKPLIKSLNKIEYAYYLHLLQKIIH
jgi:cyclic pyranopterin phosphate synthase